MSEENKNILNDEMLENVSGGFGKPIGKTKWGFPYDKDHNVLYTDKSNAQLEISAAQWNWLLGKYANGKIGDSEYYLSTVPVHDLKIVLAKHAAGELN